MSLSLSGNTLLDNGEPLRYETIRPEYLRVELILARTAILDGMNDYYHMMVAKYPDNTIDPFVPVSIMYLGQTEHVLNDVGIDNNTSLHYKSDELQPEYREYMSAIQDANFVPFVRSRMMTGRNRTSALLSLTSEEPIK